MTRIQPIRRGTSQMRPHWIVCIALAACAPSNPTAPIAVEPPTVAMTVATAAEPRLGQSVTPDACLDALVVERLAKDIGARDGLLDLPYQQDGPLAHVPANRWRSHWAAHARRLISQADTLGLDGSSLRRAISTLWDLAIADAATKGGPMAYVLTGAYAGHRGPEPVWVIAARWEHETMGDAVEVGHIRAWVLATRTGKILDLETCD